MAEEIINYTARTDNDVDNSAFDLKVSEVVKDDFGNEVTTYRKKTVLCTDYFGKIDQDITDAEMLIESLSPENVTRQITALNDKINELNTQKTAALLIKQGE